MRTEKIEQRHKSKDQKDVKEYIKNIIDESIVENRGPIAFRKHTRRQEKEKEALQECQMKEENDKRQTKNTEIQ